MKSFFSISNALRDIREVHPDALASISVEELYEFLIELIDLAKFVRRHADLHNSVKKQNPSMKEVVGSQDNVGGLVKIYKKIQQMGFTPQEKEFLEELQVRLIEAKQAVQSDKPFPRLIKTIKVQTEPQQGTIARNNRHNYWRRRQKSKSLK